MALAAPESVRLSATVDGSGSSGTRAVVERALRMIQEGALDEGSVADLARSLGIGERHLRRLFLRHVGASPIRVAQAGRLHKARRLIDETNLSMAEIALASGFGSVRRFNAAFRTTYGCTPSKLRRRRRRYAVALPAVRRTPSASQT